MSIQIAIIPVTAFQQNCSLIWCTETMHGAIVDPGGDVDNIRRAIDENGVKIEKVLVTHGHFDHAGATREVADLYSAPIEGPHRDDQFLLDTLPEEAAKYGFGSAQVFTPNRWLNEGDTVQFGNIILNVLHCPGHTPGHVVFHHPEAEVAIVGDVLFQGSIGRTDFPRGDHVALISSIKGKLWPLGDTVTFLPGHGPPSTFGDERKNNPFVGDFAS